MEIYNFQIDRAFAVLDGKKRMTVTLSYPDNPAIETKRLPPNLDRGIEIFTNLLNRGYSKINPITPASSGSLYKFKDGKLIVNRRDKDAPNHKLYHGAYSGFAATRKHVYTAEGLLANGLRESSEEVLLVTTDKKTWLIVPKDSKEYVLSSAKNFGIENLPQYEVDVSTVEPTDTLVVTDDNGKIIFKAKAFLEFIYESQTSISALQIREFPLSSDEVLPIDAEGMTKDGKFLHFNRESYIIDPAEIAGKGFGTILQNPLVYRTDFVNTPDGRVPVPRQQTEKDYKEFLGPDKVEVINPHVFAPEDLLRRALDALGVEGYAGKWMEWELWVEKCKKEGKSLLPESVIAKKE